MLFKVTSGDVCGCGAVQMGLPSKVKIFSDEHRHKNSTLAISSTLLLHKRKSTLMLPYNKQCLFNLKLRLSAKMEIVQTRVVYN